jgi:ABC-type transporter Mla subunit MlaD
MEARLLTAPSPLKGVELVDCAKANGNLGVAAAALNCGYGQDVDSFIENLRQAGQAMGLEIEDLNDLLDQANDPVGVEISPDSPSSL